MSIAYCIFSTVWAKNPSFGSCAAGEPHALPDLQHDGPTAVGHMRPMTGQCREAAMEGGKPPVDRRKMVRGAVLNPGRLVLVGALSGVIQKGDLRDRSQSVASAKRIDGASRDEAKHGKAESVFWHEKIRCPN